MYEKNELKKKAVVMMDGGRRLSLNLYLLYLVIMRSELNSKSKFSV